MRRDCLPRAWTYDNTADSSAFLLQFLSIQSVSSLDAGAEISLYTNRRTFLLKGSRARDRENLALLITNVLSIFKLIDLRFSAIIFPRLYLRMTI